MLVRRRLDCAVLQLQGMEKLPHEVLPPPSTSTRLSFSSAVSYSMRAGMILPLNRSMSCGSIVEGSQWRLT